MMKVAAAVFALAIGAASAKLNTAECINQDDFATGTFIIKESGDYKLCENIVFHPNGPGPGVPPEDAFDPIFDLDNDGTDEYDRNAFGLGFFAAISVTVPGVTLYLNEKTIEQSAGHALFQRFFSIIELANSPFIANAGPAQFVGQGSSFTPASDVNIIGPGTLGRSSHHGIHGNENSNVHVEKVTFRDFEVAAISLNNVDGATIEGCTIEQNRHDVPVLGTFSAARFIRQYGKVLADMDPPFEMNLRGTSTTAGVVYNDLITAINNVYGDVMDTGFIHEGDHPDEYKLFHNPRGVVDGPCYAFVVHGKGPAVNGQSVTFPESEDETSSDVIIDKNDISGIKCWVNEIPATVVNDSVANDARGAVFQFVQSYGTKNLLSLNDNDTYKGNVLADMQMMVAYAIAQGGYLTHKPELQTPGVNSIDSTLTDWAMSGTIPYVPSYRCNGDSMHHVSKGIIVIRVEKTAGFKITKNTISDVTNLSYGPFSECEDFHGNASPENPMEQQSGNIRGISVAAVRGYGNQRSSITQNTILNTFSDNANTICGIDVQGDSRDINIVNNEVDLDSSVGEDPNDKFIALRVREYAADVHVIGSNTFHQDTSYLNDRRLLHTAEKEVGYTSSGCPYAHLLGNKKHHGGPEL